MLGTCSGAKVAGRPGGRGASDSPGRSAAWQQGPASSVQVEASATPGLRVTMTECQLGPKCGQSGLSAGGCGRGSESRAAVGRESRAEPLSLTVGPSFIPVPSNEVN